MKTLALVVLLLGWVNIAHADSTAPQCMVYASAVDYIKTKFNETLAARGTVPTQAGGMVVVSFFVDPDDNSWTLIGTRASGCTFPIVSGNNWMPVAAINTDPAG